MAEIEAGLLDTIYAAIGDNRATARLASMQAGHVAVLSGWLLAEALFQMREEAVLLCDAGRQVMHCNKAARSLPTACAAIGRDNRFAFASRAAQQAFCTAVQQAAHRRMTNTLLIERRGGQGYQVDVTAVPAAGLVARVIIVDLEQQLRRRIESARRLYLFTPSECALAESLMLGRTPEDHAALRGTAVSTVRSQLHAMFAKSNTRRQGELIALLAR